MATPDLVLTRIPKKHFQEAKAIGRALGYKGSLVLETALVHGLPIAKAKLASVKIH